MRPVRPSGQTDHPLLALVGEAPGREEERHGKPFVGSSGHLLDQMLSVAGIVRNECYITNVVNTRPPRNDFGMHYSDAKRTKPTPELIAHRLRLREELKAVQPQVVVALGEEALRAVTFLRGIKAHRGIIFEPDTMDGRHHRVLPTYHPAYVLRVYSERSVVELDLKKAIRQARHPHRPVMEFITDPSVDEILGWLAKRHSPVAFDIESIGPCTRSVGFGWSPTEAISIPLIWRGCHRWDIEDESLILQSLKDYLADPTIEKYIQNAPFDTTMVARELGFHVEGLVLDTMYAFHLLYPDIGAVSKKKDQEAEGRKGLKFMSTIYTDLPLYWGKDRFATDENNAVYNCYDCVATWDIAQDIITELDQRGLTEFYQTNTQRPALALTRVQNRGIRIDIDAREKVRAETEARYSVAREKLTELVGYEVNPNSPKQIKELIYERYKLPVQRKPKSRSATTDNDALRALERKFPKYSPVLRAILECRQTRKIISTYIDARLVNDRAHTSYGLAVTGRITSSKTWDGLGGNLQNIPRGGFRKLYTPDPGHTLIKADLKQAEYMVFVWDAPVPELIDRYLHDPAFSIHRFNGSLIWQLPEDQITNELYSKTKNGVYGGNYQIGAQKVARMYDMTFQDAKLILDRYKRIRPELPLWWDKIENLIRTTRTLTNPLGRERIFLGRMDSELFRKAFSHFCQSTVADILNLAVVTLDDAGVEILLQVHDELVCQAPKDKVNETIAAIRSAMEIPIKFSNVTEPLIIPVEISIGPNWYDLTEYSPDINC